MRAHVERERGGGDGEVGSFKLIVFLMLIVLDNLKEGPERSLSLIDCA